MAFNVGSISAYTDQLSGELIKKAVITGPTMDILTSIIPGVKYSQAINIIDNTAVPQAGACGFTSSGSVAFKQRNITVTDLMIQESLCFTTLESYWMGMKMKKGTPGAESVNDLGPILAESYVEKVKNTNEYNLWQGNYSGSTSYTLYNGFLKTIFDEATRINLSATTGTFSSATTSATVIADVEYIFASTPAAIRSRNDLALFMPLGDFLIYAAALRTANLFHFDATQQSIAGWKINYIPGLTVYGIPGMDGAHTLHPTNYCHPWVLTYVANLVVGTDLLNEEENFDIWYSRDNKEVRVDIRWKLGTQVQFPELIVTNF